MRCAESAGRFPRHVPEPSAEVRPPAEQGSVMDCEKFDRIVLDLLYGELDELTEAAAQAAHRALFALQGRELGAARHP